MVKVRYLVMSPVKVGRKIYVAGDVIDLERDKELERSGVLELKGKNGAAVKTDSPKKAKSKPKKKKNVESKLGR